MFSMYKRRILHSWGAAVILVVGLPSIVLCQTLSDVRYNSISIVNPARGTSGSLSNVSDAATDLILQEIVFKVLKLSNLSNNQAEQSGIVNQEESIQPAVIGEALFYPNPFKLQDGAQLGYELSKNMDVEIRLYDMRGYEIFAKTYNAGTSGGLRGYNRLRISPSTFENRQVSAGIYFFLILSEGSVIAKGKFAVRP